MFGVVAKGDIGGVAVQRRHLPAARRKLLTMWRVQAGLAEQAVPQANVKGRVRHAGGCLDGDGAGRGGAAPAADDENPGAGARWPG